MFDKLFESLIDDMKLTRMKNVVSMVRDLVDEVSLDYVKDGNARDAAIDAICEILQKHKTKGL